MTGSLYLMLALVGVEMVALLLVLLSVSWFSGRAARRRDARAMQALVTRVRKGRPEREATLKRFLEQRVGLSGDALKAGTAGLLRAELAVLHRFAGIYRTRDAGSAAQFDIDLQVAVEPYHDLAVEAEVGHAEAVPDVEIDSGSEIAALREENRRLSEELQITMETMSRMLNEYSSMFSGGEPADAKPIGPSAAGAAAATEAPAASALSAADEEVVVFAGPETQSTSPETAVHDDAPDEDQGPVEGAADGDPDPTADIPIEERHGPGTDLPVEAAGGQVDRPVAAEVVAGAEGLTPMPDLDDADESEVALGVDPQAPQMPQTPSDDDKGAEIEVMSELLLAGDSELLAPEGLDGSAPAPEPGLFDIEGEGLFDAVEPQVGASEGSPQDASADLEGFDDVDDLFDADAPTDGHSEKTGRGAQ